MCAIPHGTADTHDRKLKTESRSRVLRKESQVTGCVDIAASSDRPSGPLPHLAPAHDDDWVLNNEVSLPIASISRGQQSGS